jgi:Pyridoxamine 5'-phosphate oxidase
VARGTVVTMATWSEIEAAEPAFAARVRVVLDANKHKTIATLRADGSPRISGIEVQFADGELTFGSMPRARKGVDLHRDPRFALHSASVAPPDGEEATWSGDAKVAGVAVPAGPVKGIEGELFKADLHEVVLTALNPEATALRIEWWTAARGLRCVERE